MIVLVCAMLIAFVTNLFFTGINPPALLRGLVPHRFAPHELAIAGAMLGTSFSAVAAFYQAYLVQAKGWGKDNVRTAIHDAWLGIAILGSISLVIIISAAQALHGEAEEFRAIGQLAHQLSAVLGNAALWVFSLGLAAASFSSFIANALIGGTLLADGAGFDARVNSRPTRYFTIGVMLAGCFVAVGIFLFDMGSTTSLLIAQSATLVAAPLSAILLYLLTSSKRVMGTDRNGPLALALGAAGLLVVAWLNYRLFSALLG